MVMALTVRHLLKVQWEHDSYHNVEVGMAPICEGHGHLLGLLQLRLSMRRIEDMPIHQEC